MDNFISSLFLWLAHHPFGVATIVYAVSIFGILLYAYFEPQDRHVFRAHGPDTTQKQKPSLASPQA